MGPFVRSRPLATALVASLALAPRVARAEDPLPPAVGARPSNAPEAVADRAARGAVLVGVLRDRASREPLEGAVVSVVGRAERSTTDAEGRYRLALPGGTYTLRVAAELYATLRVKGVVLAAGGSRALDLTLDLDADAQEYVEPVEADVERQSAAAQLTVRKNATRASDAVGAQDIAKTPDRNAADAIRRVVGASVVDGRYVFVRGLGGRYTNAQLNGVPLPSPEPDRQAVPLDMFPTLVLSDLTVSKTFTPDLPGDFAGGSLDIHTHDMPQKFLFSASLSAGLNTETTFRDRLSYPGGSLDWLGVDDGERGLDPQVPGRRVTRLDAQGRVNPDLQAVGRAVNRPMTTDTTFALPSGSGSFVLGDSTTLFGRKLGWVAGGTYARKFQSRRGEILRTYGVDASRPGELDPFNDYRVETGTDAVTWSGLGSLTYELDEDHRVSLTGLYSRNAEKEARLITGFNDEQASTIRDERLRFVSRGMAYGQLRGGHRFRKVGDARLDWRALYARATLSDPDLRETVYVADPTRGLVFREGTQSGQHFFADQGETTRAVGFDWTQPLEKGERPPRIKAGALGTFRGRSFQARRFRFVRNPAADPAAFRAPAQDLFRDENVGPLLELEEWTRPTDAYGARYDVVAGYGMADVPVTKRLRLLVGERVEAAKQTIDSFDPFAPTATRVRSSLDRVDLLPSAGVVLGFSDTTNLRLAATRTVARPQLRELAPFVFSDFFGAREVLGNPDLDRTRIVNLDARLEHFPGLSEVLAVSVFHKRFQAPIEPIILPTSRGVVSFQNARGAVNTGVEVEARKNLRFLARRLDELEVLANVTVVHSQVDLDTSRVGIQTSTSRPLAGQSPYVANLALDWTHERAKTRLRALYNVFGPRIAQVGQNGIPDVYEQPRSVVDVAAAQSLGQHLDLKLTLENLLDSPVRLTHGATGDRWVVSRYQLGRSAWLTATWTY